jgi:methanogenic corrinoid protein MtbC1
MRQALVRYDLDLVETTLNRHALVLPPHELIFGVVLPLLRDVGDRWEAGAICPAQEHLLSNVVRNVLGSLLRALFRSTAPGGRIVFATPAGQCHELGLLCAAVLAAGAGRAVVYLGADLPASDITHAVTRTKASTVVLANTVATPPADDVGSLKRLPAGVGILVGGAHAAALKQHLGARAQVVPTLDAFRQLL